MYSVINLTIHRSLFRDPKFVLLFVGSGIATFPLLVPPFFIPLYASSIGITAGIGSVLVAVYNLSSACGRVGFGFLGDYIGPTSSLALSMVITALSMLAIWPVSSSIAPFVAFTVINGVGNGGFFSTIPSVVGHIYGPTRVPPALAMVVTAWAAGYFMVWACQLSPIRRLVIDLQIREHLLRDIFWNVTEGLRLDKLPSGLPCTMPEA